MLAIDTDQGGPRPVRRTLSPVERPGLMVEPRVTQWHADKSRMRIVEMGDLLAMTSWENAHRMRVLCRRSIRRFLAGAEPTPRERAVFARVSARGHRLGLCDSCPEVQRCQGVVRDVRMPA